MDIDVDLRNRLKEMTMNTDEMSRNAYWVNTINEVVLKHLKEHQPMSCWSCITTGSYYEKTKIRPPNEFDIMFVCELSAEMTQKEILSSDVDLFGSLCTITSLAATESQGIRPEYICPVRFKRDFSINVQDAIQRALSGCLKCLDIEMAKATDGLPCKFWRLSFSVGEKRLLTTSRDAGENMCYKDVMKLLKSDLKDFKNSCGGHFSVGSFHIKMLVLSLLDEKPENGYWGRENIRLCYVWALGRLIKCLTDEHLPHYFVSGMNVLSKISSKAKFDGFIEFLETRRRTYAAGLNKV